MAFFKSTPNLPADEKARLEFHLQKIVECIGFERCRLPVLGDTSVLAFGSRSDHPTLDQILTSVGNHLGHDVSNINLETVPVQPEKSGGGG